MKACLTRSSSNTHAHAYWRLETESQSALTPTATLNMSKHGDGKMIIYDLCWSNNEAKLLKAANHYFVPFLAETSGFLCPSLQSLEQGSFTSFTKWHRRNDHMRKRQVAWVSNLTPCLSSVGARMSLPTLKLICDISRRSRRRRKTLQVEENLSDQSPPVPVETPREHSHPLNLHLTRLSQDPTDTTENHIIRLTNGTLAMTVHMEINKIMHKIMNLFLLWNLLARTVLFNIILYILILQIGETGRGTVNTITLVTATSLGRETGITHMTRIATRITMVIDVHTETIAAQAVTATIPPLEKGHMISTAMTGTIGVTDHIMTGELLKSAFMFWFSCFEM